MASSSILKVASPVIKLFSSANRALLGKPREMLPRNHGKVQELCMYKMYERNRESPAHLRLNQKQVENALGDLVPFTNKIFHENLKKQLGITAGLCVLIEHIPEKNGGDYTASTSATTGTSQCMAPTSPTRTSTSPSLAASGSSPVPTARQSCSSSSSPSRSSTPFTCRESQTSLLTAELLGAPMPPSPTVEPTPEATACEPHHTIKNFTD
ncbi:hypothetical protein Taro_014138 [Colocasia esculenta]|uniref:allene-oxide cyclase n=1 Tax=Colocasia esculenta TaxID=4460 RepID=A0A843UI63_COLES|nr:hypothetical protein [Colocasia esculenta]